MIFYDLDSVSSSVYLLAGRLEKHQLFLVPCYGAFIVMTPAQSEELTKTGGMGDWLTLAVAGDALAILDRRKSKDKMEQVQRLREICGLGIAALVKNHGSDGHLKILDDLLLSINGRDVDPPLPKNDEPYLTSEQVSEFLLTKFTGIYGPPVNDFSSPFNGGNRHYFRGATVDKTQDHNKWLEKHNLHKYVLCEYCKATSTMILLTRSEDLVFEGFYYKGYVIVPQLHHDDLSYGCWVENIQCEKLITMEQGGNLFAYVDLPAFKKVSAMKRWIDSGFKGEERIKGYVWAKDFIQAGRWLRAERINKELLEHGENVADVIAILSWRKEVFEEKS